ncbi:Protein of unknown function [Halopenitus persicus]|uniref:DUF2848 domain-containing protein n=2 Tax=Halopenitus persicus TaxID=1048396 RepID=A0A1H3L2L9_9EURY|nr:Protein of unknown function [Halopenitus persicus]
MRTHKTVPVELLPMRLAEVLRPSERRSLHPPSLTPAERAVTPAERAITTAERINRAPGETTTMTTLDLTVRRADGSTRDVTVPIRRIANCGMATRNPDPDRIDRMFEELATIGVTRPETLPMVVPKPPHLLTTDSEIVVNAATTGGELEFVLLPTADRTYVGVGVDHKDDHVMDRNLHRANSTCPSVIADEVWRLEDVRDRWDDLEISCWTGRGDDRELYQRATLDAFLRPDALLEAIDAKTTAPLAGTAVWSGTVSTDADGDVDARPDVTYGDFYAMQLYDPAANRRIAHQYDVSLNDWVDDCELP